MTTTDTATFRTSAFGTPERTARALAKGTSVEELRQFEYLGQIQLNILKVADAAEPDSIRIRAAKDLLRLPFLQQPSQSRRRLSEDELVTALFTAIGNAFHPQMKFPRLRPGEEPTIQVETDGSETTLGLAIPIYVGATQRFFKKCQQLPAAEVERWRQISKTGSKTWDVPEIMQGHPWTIPWNWPWTYFFRGYLPWALRREVEKAARAEESCGIPIEVFRSNSGDEQYTSADLRARQNDPAAAMLCNRIVEQLSPRERAWYFFFYKMGLTPALVCDQFRFKNGMSKDRAKKARQRLELRLEEIIARETEPGGFVWAADWFSSRSAQGRRLGSRVVPSPPVRDVYHVRPDGSRVRAVTPRVSGRLISWQPPRAVGRSESASGTGSRCSTCKAFCTNERAFAFHDCGDYLRQRTQAKKGDNPVEILDTLADAVSTLVGDVHKQGESLGRIEAMLAERFPDDEQIRCAVDELIEDAIGGAA
ncbi:MAG: hypothetical protein M3R70_04130 [Actinomycetota bacterium]|nr:hypothetical protein [Actinomycetota bacterium]